MTQADFLTRADVRDAYQRNAKFYDFAVLLYYLIGIRIGLWRRLVMKGLELRRGDTVVEIGCGTGLNFALIEERIGGEGKIIAVDISEAMLEIAQERVRSEGWDNIELVCTSAYDYSFPEHVDGILSTGALTFDPEYDKVVERGAEALAPGRHWVLLDYKKPTGWLRHLTPLFIALTRSYGVSQALMERRAWQSIERHLNHTKMQELYGGFVYIISGKAS